MKLTLGTLAAATAFTLILALPASAQTSQAPAPPQAQEPHVHPAPDAATKDTPAAGPHDMHAMHSMMASMSASHATLQKLVEAMNAATGPQKTEAIAALVTAMVQNQHAMHEAMAAHMAECPMMKMGNMQSMPKGQAKP